LENKISTWDNLIKCGKITPSLCSLCFKDVESVDHIFVHCDFTKKVWSDVKGGLHLNMIWRTFPLYTVWKCGIKMFLFTNNFQYLFVGEYGELKTLLFLKIFHLIVR